MDAELLAVLRCILIPFAGTALGAACVFLVRGALNSGLQRAFSGFAAGVMVAASVWSLLVPALEQGAQMGMGGLSFMPAFAGLWAGVLFLLVLDRLVPHLHLGSDESEGLSTRWSKNTKFVLAVTLHNIPEGMAVGVVCAGLLAFGFSNEGGAGYTEAAALALAVGLAIQNFPEGAIVSLPLRADGSPNGKAFALGVLSGVVEPVAAGLTLLAASMVAPALPYLLAFAAGAMLYVVVEELVPQMSQGGHSHVGTLFFAVGFSLMMVLDVALG